MAPIDLIACLVSDELTRRADRLLERRRKQAGFRDPDKTLDNFDFTFNPKMNRSLVFDLATAALDLADVVGILRAQVPRMWRLRFRHALLLPAWPFPWPALGIPSTHALGSCASFASSALSRLANVSRSWRSQTLRTPVSEANSPRLVNSFATRTWP